MRRAVLALALALAATLPGTAAAAAGPVPTRIVAQVGGVYSGPVGGVASDSFDPLQTTIDWGDGTPAEPGATVCIDCADGVALQSISGTHTYHAAGQFAVVVVVLDTLTGQRLLVRSSAVVRARLRPRARVIGPLRARPGARLAWRVPVTLPAHARRLYTFWRLGSAGPGLHASGGGRFVRGMSATTGSVITGVIRRRGKQKLQVHVADDLGDSLHLALDLVGAGVIGHHPPQAGFQFYDFPTAGQGVEFWGDFSDPGLPDAALHYHWDFGDGGTADSAGNPTVTHSYALGGRYTVHLTVANGNGSDTLTDTVTVIGTKICDSVTLRGIRAFFSGCLLPFETGADGVLSYIMSSTSPIAINGVFFRPINPLAPIVLKPATGTVWSAVTLERPFCPTNKKCDFIGASGGFTIPPPDGAGEAIVSEGINANLVGKIAGFALAGTATLHLFADYQRPAVYEANVILPAPFAGSGAVKEGASLADFTIKAPNASFGPLQVTDLVLTRTAGVTSATGRLVLYDGPSAAATFAFSPGGTLTGASADATFNPGIPIGPLVELDDFHAAFGGSPFNFTGSGTFGTTARLLGAPVVQGTGCLLFGVLGAGQSLDGCTVPGTAPFTASPATVMRVSGTASLFGKISLGSGFVDLSTATGLWFGGAIDYSFPPGVPIVGVSGTVAGHIANPAKWQVKADLSGCIKHVKCTGVDALVSTRGIVACTSFWWGDPGGYYRWSGGWGLMMHGCDVDATGGVAVGQAAGPRVLARSAASATVHLTGGRRFEVIAVSGVGASPTVTLTGPRGVRVVDDGQPFQQHGRTAAIFHLDEDGVPPSPDGSYVPNTTYIYVIRPRAGTWTVTTNAGSSAITSARTARSLPAARVRARVRHLGGRRYALDYDLRQIRGQSVAFVEVGRRPLVHALGSATSGRGTIRFTAALGPAGTRTIEAQVEQDGLPRAVIRAARFRTPAATLPRPAAAARAAGTTLRIRWFPVPEAVAYLVDARLSDGRHLRLTVRAGTNRVTIPGFVRTDSARITVAATGGGVRGPARKITVAARGKAAPVVL